MLRTQLLWIAFFLCTLPAARAEDTPPITTLLGAGFWSRPAYDGADTTLTVLIPVVRYYGQPLFARTTFGILEGGFRTELLNDLTVGAQLAYEGGRDSTEAAFLTTHNIATLSPSLSLGLHAELTKKAGPMPLIVLLRYRQDVDGDRGAQTDLRLTAGVYSGGGLMLGIFAQATWANTQSTQYYYGIQPQQSLASGLAAFNPQSGPLFNAEGLLWSYDLHANWILLGSFELRQLRGDALNSPLVQMSSSRYASIGLAYEF